MAKYRKKPVVVEAFQFNRASMVEGKEHCVCYGRSAQCVTTDPHVHTIHAGQVVLLEDGDWVLPEPDGIHFYPVKPDIFAATYEPVEEFSFEQHHHSGLAEEKFPTAGAEEEEREQPNKRLEGFAKEW